MKKRPLLDQHASLEALIAYMNTKPAWIRHQLAGCYACEEAAAHYSSDAEMIDDYYSADGGDFIFQAHLNVLEDNGCRLTGNEALEWAKGYADLPFDLGD